MKKQNRQLITEGEMKISAHLLILFYPLLRRTRPLFPATTLAQAQADKETTSRQDKGRKIPWTLPGGNVSFSFPVSRLGRYFSLSWPHTPCCAVALPGYTYYAQCTHSGHKERTNVE